MKKLLLHQNDIKMLLISWNTLVLASAFWQFRCVDSSSRLRFSPAYINNREKKVSNTHLVFHIAIQNSWSIWLISAYISTVNTIRSVWYLIMRLLDPDFIREQNPLFILCVISNELYQSVRYHQKSRSYTQSTHLWLKFTVSESFDRAVGCRLDKLSKFYWIVASMKSWLCLEK